MIFLWCILSFTFVFAHPAQPPSINASTEIVWAKYGGQATIKCGASGDSPFVVDWWRFRPATYIGRYDSATGEVSYKNVSIETRER